MNWSPAGAQLVSASRSRDQPRRTQNHVASLAPRDRKVHGIAWAGPSHAHAASLRGLPTRNSGGIGRGPVTLWYFLRPIGAFKQKRKRAAQGQCHEN